MTDTDIRNAKAYEAVLKELLKNPLLDKPLTKEISERAAQFEEEQTFSVEELSYKVSKSIVDELSSNNSSLERALEIEMEEAFSGALYEVSDTSNFPKHPKIVRRHSIAADGRLFVLSENGKIATKGHDEDVVYIHYRLLG